MNIRSKDIELWPIEKIMPNELNRNKHTDEQIERLCKIIEYQGFRSPLIISSLTGMLVAGHGRLMAAKKMGLTQLPVMVQDFDSPDQEYAAMVSENSIASWAELDLSGINNDLQHLNGDFDLDLLGLKNFVLEPAELLPTVDPDAVPDLPTEPKTRMGDIWVLGRHRLMCGDSTNIQSVEHLMNGQKADMVFTDPPYGINENCDRVEDSKGFKKKGVAQAGVYDQIIGDESIDTACGAFSVADSLSEIICYWGGNYYAHKLPPSPCWIVWDKREEDIQRDVNSDCELAYVKHPHKRSVRIFRHLWKGMIKASEHGESRVHPTQKPIALAEWCFNELDPKGKSVLDLFGGSGSTLIACEKQDRTCFMMELDPKYCDVIVKRWCEFTGHDAVRDDGKKWSEL